jgi:C4-dicarboxylate transporter, DctQ subunit
MDQPQAVLEPQQPAVYEALRQKAATELGEGAEAPPSLVARIEGLLVGGLAILALVLCTYNVVVRYFHPAWTLEMIDEVQVYVIVWAVFLALGAVTISDRHVKSDLFVSFFPPPLRHAVEVFVDLLGLGFGVLLIWYGGLAAYQSWSYGDVSTTSLRFPLWIYVSALPAGGLTLAIGYVTRLMRQFSARSTT